jgi:hypothetical protein
MPHPGDNGRLLQMLDPDVQAACPVHPRHAQEGATFHLTRELVDNLDHNVLTCGNANNVCSQMCSRKNQECKARLVTCHSCQDNLKHTFQLEIGLENFLLMARR